jgi:hypothetical protein
MALAHGPPQPSVSFAERRRQGMAQQGPYRQPRASLLLRPLKRGECLSFIARRADVIGVAQQQGEGSVLPKLVGSGNLSREIGSWGDAGLTREVENGKGSLGTRGNLCCGCRDDDRIRACRATNETRHAGIGVPTHHKRTVTSRPPQ